MDNQHRLIKGYRDLSAEGIALMIEVKQQGEQLSALINQLDKLPLTDKRWLDIGTKDLQTGIMALVPSIARPTGF